MYLFATDFDAHFMENMQLFRSEERHRSAPLAPGRDVAIRAQGIL